VLGPGRSAASFGNDAVRERRQITVLFCDLVGSTALGNALDPEDFREVMEHYRALATRVVHRHEGFVAQYQFDALKVYFGYPSAREDDAERAVLAGLQLVHAVQQLELKVRVGIATGIVVSGELVGEGTLVEEVTGPAPHLAQRLQTAAAPNAVLISTATHRLLGDLFEYVDLGPLELKGFSEPERAWQVVRPRPVASAFEAYHPARSLPPLVGREKQLDALIERWRCAHAGSGQVAMVRGEAGIGKSRLVHQLISHVRREPAMILRYSCAQRFQNTALHPLIAQIERTTRISPDEPSERRFGKLQSLFAETMSTQEMDEILPYLAELLEIPLGARSVPPDQHGKRRMERMLALLCAQLVRLSRVQPLLVIAEDLHWADPTSLELLAQFVPQVAGERLLLVATSRPPPPLEFPADRNALDLELQPLEAVSAAAIVSFITGGKPLPTPVLEQILTRSTGVPLYLEELTKAVMESGQLEERPDHYSSHAPAGRVTVPTTLHDSLMARLDRCPGGKRIAQIAGTIGPEFEHVVLASVASVSAEELASGIRELIDAGLISKRDVSGGGRLYSFRHVLLQEIARDSLLRSGRQELHGRIARVLEQVVPQSARARPEVLAHHYAEAGLAVQAVAHLKLAGNQALRRSANQEASNHLRRALELVRSMADSLERKQQELELETMLGQALMALKGYAAAEVEATYGRAETLRQQLADQSKLFAVLRGQFQVALLQARYQLAGQVIEQLAALARAQGDANQNADGELGHGLTALYLGRFADAKRHLENSLALRDPGTARQYAEQYGIDLGGASLAYRARALWFLGLADQALAGGRDALEHAESFAVSLNIAQATGMLAMIHQTRGDIGATRQWAERTIEYSSDRGHLYWVALGSILKGWALCRGGDGAAGVGIIRSNLNAYATTGARLGRSWYLALLAEAHQHAGDWEEGLAAVHDAHAHIAETGEGYYAAEVHRQEGELLLASSGAAAASQAEACFGRALAIADGQQAAAWALRAATSLASLWSKQGAADKAAELLRGALDRITEGGDTADVREASLLLRSVGARPPGQPASVHR
jgi:class 3 adenylate cyclase/predicted ATPase